MIKKQQSRIYDFSNFMQNMLLETLETCAIIFPAIKIKKKCLIYFEFLISISV